MGRASGSWLGGPRSAGTGLPPGGWRGRRLGLPAEGPGSVATLNRRLAAFAVDLLAGAAIGGLANAFVRHPSPGTRGLAANAAFLLEVAVLVGLTGQSLGMRALGLRVLRLVGPPLPGLGWSAVRTVLLVLLVPAVIWDRDSRGLHDRASGTVVVRA
ncbi:MAG: RDD family protein [Actinomycetota bacterium]|nr:RDD family protein [Actinomycetota bacterium]